MSWRELDVASLKNEAMRLGLIFDAEAGPLQLAGLIEAKKLGIDPAAVFDQAPECFGSAWDGASSDICAACDANSECGRVFSILLRQRQAAGGTPEQWAEEFGVSDQTVQAILQQPVIPALMPTAAPLPPPLPPTLPPVAVAPQAPVLQIPAVQPAASAAAPAKRGPGRPKKNPEAPAAVAAPAKRGPGRPKKNPEAPAAVAAPAKRGPGRPKKNPEAPAAVAAPVKRGPGRPKKNPEAVAAAMAADAAAAVQCVLESKHVNVANFPGLCSYCQGTGRHGAGLCLVCGGTGRAQATNQAAATVDQGPMAAQYVASQVGPGAGQVAAHGGIVGGGNGSAAHVQGAPIPGNGAGQVLPAISGQPGIPNAAGGNGGDLRPAWAASAMPVVGGQVFSPGVAAGARQPGINETLGGPYIQADQAQRVRELLAQGWDLSIALQRVGVVVIPF